MGKDQLGELFPISIDFKSGEQPDSSKLSGFASQTESAVNKISEAIGDLWIKDTSNKAFPSNPDDPVYSAVSNIARFIGPASFLNPKRQGGQTFTLTLDVSQIPYLVNEFSLTEPHSSAPLKFAPVTADANGISLADGIKTALNTLDSTVFQTFKTSKDALSSAGDYYVDLQGNVYTYTKTDLYLTGSDQPFDINIPGDLYYRARMTVIPDWQDSTNYCTVADAGSYYTVTLPTISSYIQRDATGARLQPGDELCAPANFQALLPDFLSSANGLNLSTGDIIPDGLIRLWDDSSKEMIDGATFKYESNTVVRVEGATLTTGSDRYRLLVAGSSLSEVVLELVRRFELHEHNSPLHGKTIKHYNLFGNLLSPSVANSTWGLTIEAPVSAIEGNDHPQYLLRYGWANGIDAANSDNAMLGDLFMAANVTNYTSGYTASTGTSRKIYFANTNTYMHADLDNSTFEFSTSVKIKNQSTSKGGILELQAPSSPVSRTDASKIMFDTDAIIGYWANNNSFFLSDDTAATGKTLQIGALWISDGIVSSTIAAPQLTLTLESSAYPRVYGETEDGEMFRLNTSANYADFRLETASYNTVIELSNLTGKFSLYSTTASGEISVQNELLIELDNDSHYIKFNKTLSNLDIGYDTMKIFFDGSTHKLDLSNVGSTTQSISIQQNSVTIDASNVFIDQGYMLISNGGTIIMQIQSNIPRFYFKTQFDDGILFVAQSAPTGENGRLYYDSSSGRLRFYHNGWHTLAYTV